MASVLADIGGSRVRMAHFFWKHTLRWGDSAIDATCGNGKDSLAIARLMAECGPNNPGKLFGFDVQAHALQQTRTQLSKAGVDMNKVLLFNQGHEKMKAIIDKEQEAKQEGPLKVKLVTFNLGYLPGGDKAIHTQTDTTVAAVGAASQLIVPGGVISIVLYPHEEGLREAHALRQWCKSLSLKDFLITNVMTPLDGEHQPSILFVTRRLISNSVSPDSPNNSGEDPIS